jgi:hypothetical protein
MTIYPEDQKAELIERMVGVEKASVPDLHRETGIAERDIIYLASSSAALAWHSPEGSPTRRRALAQ